MRLALVVNPNATRFAARRRDEVVRLLAARHKLEVHHTTHPGHATELTRRALADGCEALLVMGGDGTINEVVNGLAGAAVPLGLVGGGKTNVLVRALGLPDDSAKAAARQLELLESGERRLLSLGTAGGRRFTFSAGLGLDGAIVREVERRRRAKQLYGDRAYVAAGMMTLLVGYDRDTPHLTLYAEGRAPLRGFFALIGNGDPFTYLGRRPFRPTPLASFEGGMDVLVGLSMATTALARALTAMLSARPRRAAFPDFPVLHDLRGFTLEADVPLALQLDGEYLGDHTSLVFEHLPDALTVIAPRRAGSEPGGPAGR
jgi:diacylglycerol kinase family enzyme